MLKLDSRDIKILAVLTREGRISKAELAERVNLTATPCWERLRRLEAAGIIQGYHADIALNRLGPSVTVFVMVELGRHKAEDFQVFERTVAGFEEIVTCWALGGGFDYLMQVTTRDIDRYQRLIDELLARRISVARYYSYIVTKSVKTGSAPPLAALFEDLSEVPVKSG